MNKKFLLAGLITALLILAGYRFFEITSQNVAISDTQPVRVEALTIDRQYLATWVFAEGTAQALRKAYLNFEQAGKVTYLGKHHDGTMIREGIRVFGPSEETVHGQLLARLDNRENVSQVEALEARLQSTNQPSQGNRSRRGSG